MDIEKTIEKLNKYKRENHNKEFDEAYKKYQKEVEYISGGLVETNKADFIKQYAFYTTVVYPVIEEYWNAYLGKGKYSKQGE